MNPDLLDDLLDRSAPPTRSRYAKAKHSLRIALAVDAPVT